MAKQNKPDATTLRKLPSVDALLKDPDLAQCVGDTGRKIVVDSIRRAIDDVRELLLSQTPTKLDENTIR